MSNAKRSKVNYREINRSIEFNTNVSCFSLPKTKPKPKKSKKRKSIGQKRMSMGFEESRSILLGISELVITRNPSFDENIASNLKMFTPDPRSEGFLKMIRVNSPDMRTKTTHKVDLRIPSN